MDLGLWGGVFDKFIHAFHMPMFFIVSGMLFDVKNTSQVFFRKKAKSLLLPYIVFGLLHYVMWVIKEWPDVNLTPLMHVLFINTEGMPIAGALYFLTALFFAEIFYYFISRYVSRELLRHFLIVIISLFGCMASTVLPFRLPYALDVAFVGTGLLHIGFLYKKYEYRLKRILELKIHELLLIGIAVIILIFVNGYVNMRTGNYAVIPLFWINVVLATVVGLNLAKYLIRCTPCWLRSYLGSVGMNSIVYLCMNQIVILFVWAAVEMFIPISIISKCCIFIICMIMLWIVEKVIMNTKLCIVMGK